MSAELDDKQVDDENELGRTIYWGRPSIRKGIRKILKKKKILNETYCSTVENKLSEIANSSKNLLLGLIFNL